MTTSHEYKTTGRGRHEALREEQNLCLEALESGDYDGMSDQEWVALCERVASGRQQHAETASAPDAQ